MSEANNMKQTEALSVKDTLKLARRAINNLIASSHLKDPQPWRDARQDSVDALTAIEKALAQPEQEPVTWRNAAIRVGEDLCSVGPFGYYDMTAEQWLDWALSVVTVHAPPPQRTWVGLEPEDRLCAKYMQDAPDGIEAVIDYIVAKLKQKNGYTEEKNT